MSGCSPLMRRYCSIIGVCSECPAAPSLMRRVSPTWRQRVPGNMLLACREREEIGYRIRDKRMTVLNFWCARHRDTTVDVFVTEPFDFDEECGRALVKPLGSVAVRFVSIPSLIRMKEIAGRPQDKIDIDYLRKLADAGK